MTPKSAHAVQPSLLERSPERSMLAVTHPALGLPSSPVRARGPIEPLSVRISVAVQITGISRSKLYELIRSGDIRTVKIGAATLIPMDSLKRLVENGAQ